MLLNRVRFQFFRRAHWAAPGLMRPQSGTGPRVLLYHNVERHESPLVRALGITITPRNFEAHLRYLKRYHHLIAFSKLDEHRGDPDAVAITFDDGCKSFVTEALPLLERFQCPVKLYIAKDLLGGIAWLNKLSYLLCTLSSRRIAELARDALRDCPEQPQRATIFDFIGRFHETKTPPAIDQVFHTLHPGRIDNLYMTEDDVRQILIHPLIELGSHTRRHYPLSRLSPSTLQSEVVDAHHEMNRLFADKLTGFCIPFGYRSELTEAVIGAIRQIDRQVVSAYGGRVDDSKIHGMPEIKRTGVWGNIGVLWHRMRWPN